MPTLSERIEGHLTAAPLRDQLVSLFTQTLAWGVAGGQLRALDLAPSARGGDDTLHLTIWPVAQLAGIPVFRVDWPFGSLPNLSQRRAVYKALATSHLEHLLCYVTSDNQQAAFVWARSRNGKTELRTLPYEVGAPARTTLDQLAHLAFTYQELGMFGEPPLTLVLDKLNAAFDVEAVTKRFFKQYGETFDRVESLIEGIPAEDKARKRLFTQRLFNRLMFIAFIQRKGWLKLGSTRDYLNALWSSYRHDLAPTGDFYASRLKLLFFVGLNNRASQDYSRDAAGEALRAIIGEVPYLNGGLFEELDDDRDPAISVPDDALDAILNDLFAHFNFTVTESTPLDLEVAVDPEMLGKVFEHLVTGRHESGSYYTPKPIVSFMCREALKGYLKHALPTERPDALDTFVDQHSPDDLRDFEAVLAALKRVTVCDPACGSGAYLLGMLHELLDLRHALFATSRHLDPITTYDRKLEIIQNNLYGVDLEDFAVNIARLRLWLSLAVDFDGPKPEPLPNLDFKIEPGDSVTGPAPVNIEAPSNTNPDVVDAAHKSGHVGSLMEPITLRDKFVKEYVEAKERFLTVQGHEKLQLREEIESIKTSIQMLTSRTGTLLGFDWQVEFAEIFVDGGFDIIVANPPYVRQELIKELKPALRATHPAVYTGVADLYVYFYSRALQLLCPSGMLAFISSNKWFRANYGTKLREYIAKSCQVYSITDFGDLPVFENAAAYAMIFIAQKSTHRDVPTIYTEVQSLQPPYPDVLVVTRQQGQSLPAKALNGTDWALESSSATSVAGKMKLAGLPLAEYVKDEIYRGIVTGFNLAFMIDDTTRTNLIAQDANSKDLIKPLAIGRDLKKWRIEDKTRWLIFTRRGVNINAYPAIRDYLAQWQEDLTPKVTGTEEKGRKPGRYKWYEIQDEVAYYPAFEKPKIVWGNLGLEPGFAFAAKPLYVMAPANLIPIHDLYLLGVLNSEASRRFFIETSIQRGGNYLEFKPIYVKQLPIPNAPAADRTAIADLVQKCLDVKGVKGVGCEEYDREINERVAGLYRLDTN